MRRTIYITLILSACCAATAAEAQRMSWYDSNEESQTPFEQYPSWEYKQPGATAAGSGPGIQFTQEGLEDIIRQMGSTLWK